jgi:hypothetical protein
LQDRLVLLSRHAELFVLQKIQLAACFVKDADELRGMVNGLVAEPGFVVMAPGSGVMRIPPVSVCHQVSTIGSFSFPTFV